MMMTSLYLEKERAAGHRVKAGNEQENQEASGNTNNSNWNHPFSHSLDETPSVAR